MKPSKKEIKKMKEDRVREIERMRHFRKKNFKVWTKQEPHFLYKDEYGLYITHNGFQATAISVLPEEVDRIIRALKEIKKK